MTTDLLQSGWLQKGILCRIRLVRSARLPTCPTLQADGFFLRTLGTTGMAGGVREGPYDRHAVSVSSSIVRALRLVAAEPSRVQTEEAVLMMEIPSAYFCRRHVFHRATTNLDITQLCCIYRRRLPAQQQNATPPRRSHDGRADTLRRTPVVLLPVTPRRRPPVASPCTATGALDSGSPARGAHGCPGQRHQLPTSS